MPSSALQSEAEAELYIRNLPLKWDVCDVSFFLAEGTEEVCVCLLLENVE